VLSCSHAICFLCRCNLAAAIRLFFFCFRREITEPSELNILFMSIGASGGLVLQLPREKLPLGCDTVSSDGVCLKEFFFRGASSACWALLRGSSSAE